ncbi:uncharacterized protein LOC143182179 isoform X2 [Calliopsis andreniformis]|uniref:uncharacterized protein LOC143182179 isoform X2 n=1 Tax=Calliopsis andreniformis TaxID=337506 RepID=UPI003FCE191E
MMNDDPREVLALLNSLGFVGITAQQLKDFMKGDAINISFINYRYSVNYNSVPILTYFLFFPKDLKLYRKVKEREKVQRKEEIKRKIVEKQQNVIKEILREQKREFCSTENTISTDSSNSYVNHSLVRVKVKCLSSDKENKESINSDKSCIGIKQKLDTSKSKFKEASDYSNFKSNNTSCNNENIESHLKNKHTCSQCLKHESYMVKKYRSKIDNKRIVHQEKPVTPQTVRPMSAPNILERDQELVGSTQAKSISSIKTPHSSAKSFIRPWRLHTEAQKGLNIKKSDPVMLYQKYQQEWKQMSFPGEAKHASLRWAIREKMLVFLFSASS